MNIFQDPFGAKRPPYDQLIKIVPSQDMTVESMNETHNLSDKIPGEVLLVEWDDQNQCYQRKTNVTLYTHPNLSDKIIAKITFHHENKVSYVILNKIEDYSGRNDHPGTIYFSFSELEDFETNYNIEELESIKITKTFCNYLVNKY